ncbi:General secretion pathway protein F [Anaerovibrio sp. JC8]|uniref:type II secretion system F family protein n=1 Tax=Anaerovibrio sp. JC8 TaxID=1240085 RepID=UPI000A0E2C1A|nr:type II secretion system F family protein [Anaerovibrio sp. JC8]ORT99575.1 General secretion pathway protein F [Anaerovibrio sp. JC8]
MKIFEYSVIDNTGKRSVGIIQAESREAAYGELKKQSVVILGLSEKKRPRLMGKIRGSGKEHKIRKSHFYRKGALLMRAGIPIDEVVGLMEEENAGGGRLKEKLAGGVSLAGAMSACGRLFSSQEIAMVEAGEYGGNLEWVFSSLASHFERREKLQQNLKMAMAYPLFLIFLSVCSLIFIVTVVLPVVLDIFVDLSLELPWPTRFLMTVSHLSSGAAGLVLAVIVLLALGVTLARSRPWVARWLDKGLLSFPFLGRLWLMKDMSVLLGTLSMLLDSGIVIDKAMANCAALCSNGYLRYSFQQMASSLARGNSLQSCMADGLYPVTVRSMVAAGETSGELTAMLRHAGEYCTEATENRVRVIETMAEPVIVSLLGMVIGFIVISVVWPMLELMTGYI